MEPIQSQIASSVKESQSEPEAKMTPSEFKQYNRLAEQMDVFHNMFRESWNTMYNACKNNKLPSGMSNRKFLSLGLGFCEHLEGHHSIEENYLYPILAKKMPAFRKEVELLTQHKNIHKGLEKLQVYLQDCDKGQKSIEFSELKEIMESFGEVLWQHLDDEVKELGANEMRKYWTLNELKKIPM